jgi:hypothetical protein
VVGNWTELGEHLATFNQTFSGTWEFCCAQAMNIPLDIVISPLSPPSGCKCFSNKKGNRSGVIMNVAEGKLPSHDVYLVKSGQESKMQHVKSCSCAFSFFTLDVSSLPTCLFSSTCSYTSHTRTSNTRKQGFLPQCRVEL